MTIRWSRTAVLDLKAIREYIAKDRPTAARRIALRIRDSVRHLEQFPLSGKIGRVPNTREFVIPGSSYIVVYKIEDDEVLIAAVLHGRQNWPESS